MRLLLDTLPSTSASSASEHAPLSPTGWSDLPSDAEDTFFLAADEVEDYHREKRRRMIEQSREDRMRALRAELGEEEDQGREEDSWGGSDEEVSRKRAYSNTSPAQCDPLVARRASKRINAAHCQPLVHLAQFSATRDAHPRKPRRR